MLLLTSLYTRYAAVPAVAGALHGMGAVAAGLVLATALRLAPGLKKNAMGRGDLLRFAALATFVAIGLLHWPMVWIVLGLGGTSVAYAWWRLRAVMGGSVALAFSDWLGLFAQFLMLSMLAVGGAMATAPDMHRYLVVEHGWLSDAQFTSSIAIAQAAPGPNLLFVAVLGWNVAGLAGTLATMLGILIRRARPWPSRPRAGARSGATAAACAPSPPAWRRSRSASCSPPAMC